DAVSPPSGAVLSVRLGGEIQCAGFPYSCRATLSVLPPDTALADDWLPPDTDPWWGPAWQGMTANAFDPKPVGAMPTLPMGRSELLVLVLGSSDVVSFRPDGRRGEDRLGECRLDVDVDAEAQELPIRITFEPADPSTFAVTCTIESR